MTATSDAAPPPAAAGLRRDLLLSIVLNAAIPVILYKASKLYWSASELTALTIAALFPLAWSLIDFARTRSLDPVAAISVASIVLSMAAVTFGGSPRLLLIRESFFTGAFGVACFVSLMTPRPLLFYFVRHFAAGRDRGAIEEFNAGWTRPGFRHTIRMMTVVWGAMSLLEFIVRVTLVYTLSSASVLVISPIVLGALLIATISWTFSYGRRARERGRTASDGYPAA